jgi:deoxyribonuclease IV
VNVVIPSAPTSVPRAAIGSHVAVGGGLVRAGLCEAAEVDAEVIQIFASSPRAWRQSRVDRKLDTPFRERCAALSVPVFVHASHLINVGTPSAEARESSTAPLGHTLRRAADLGARGIVVHAGTSVSRGVETRHWRNSLAIIGRLLDEAPERVQLLIEPTSGGGEAFASTVDSTIEYLAAIDDEPRGSEPCQRQPRRWLKHSPIGRMSPSSNCDGRKLP